MQPWDYTAKAADGKISSGVIEAEDRLHAADKIRALGLNPVGISASATIVKQAPTPKGETNFTPPLQATASTTIGTLMFIAGVFAFFNLIDRDVVTAFLSLVSAIVCGIFFIVLAKLITLLEEIANNTRR